MTFANAAAIDLELYSVVDSITPDAFIEWSRSHLGIVATAWTDQNYWRRVSGELGITAAAYSKGGLAQRGHAYLIIETNPQQTITFDPFGAFRIFPTRDIDDQEIMLSANLDNTILSKRSPSKKYFLHEHDYRLNLDPTTIPRQTDSHNCGPIALYAGLKTCATTLGYDARLKIPALKEVARFGDLELL